MRRFLILLATLLPLSALATIPPALQTLQKKGWTIGQSFIGPDGLTGWVISNTNKNVVVYTTSSGNYIIDGQIVDKDGQDLSSVYAQRYLPRPDLTKLVTALQQDPTLVDEGDAKAVPLYVFADPNCFYCNKLWSDIRPFVDSGQVRIHWVVLSFLKQSSAGRATAILAAKDRLAAFTLDESKFDKVNEEGGIPPLEPMPANVRDSLVVHANQMRDAGGQGTPLMVFRSEGKWYTLEGMPVDMKAFVTGLQQPAASR
ncbi:MAG TPA: thiol:disulfide interchange protein DsbG [Gammaproteobacteria bacterium]|jgi:thiol:disulfide interchange protein DsbG